MKQGEVAKAHLCLLFKSRENTKPFGKRMLNGQETANKNRAECCLPMSVVSSMSSNKSSSNVSDFKRNSVKGAFNSNQVQGDVSEMVCDQKRITESPVRRRIFPNSNVCAKSTNTLLARGNKHKVLHNMKHFAPNLSNSSITQAKGNRSCHTMIFKRSEKVHKAIHSQGDKSYMGDHIESSVDRAA